MYVWYLSEASDTEDMNRLPPLPDPDRKLNIKLRTREMVDNVMVIRLLVSGDMMMGYEVCNYSAWMCHCVFYEFRYSVPTRQFLTNTMIREKFHNRDRGYVMQVQPVLLYRN